MPRKLQKLSAKAVENIKKSGYHSDGGGLYLQVSITGTKSWLFCYTRAGKSREMGLGSLVAVPLSDARDKAAKCRGQLASDIDPIEAREAERQAKEAEAAKSKTFEFCMEGFIAAHKSEWKNNKSQQAWRNTLSAYCLPVFKDRPVSAIDTPLIIAALQPIWEVKHETATRIRARLARVFDWAKVSGFRTGENPARWEGHLKEVFSTRAKVARVKHHPALPYSEMPVCIEKLHQNECTAALALEFTILTATRTTMVRFAVPEEFSEDFTVWTIPGERMKGREGVPPPHVVPLSPRATEIIKAQVAKMKGPYIFPGEKNPAKKPMNANAMSDLAEKLGYKGIATPHGFRASFRTWVDEVMPNLAGPVAEVALSHKLGGGDETQAAYRRGALLEKRRRLMNAWAKHCATPQAKCRVVQLRRKA